MSASIAGPDVWDPLARKVCADLSVVYILDFPKVFSEYSHGANGGGGGGWVLERETGSVKATEEE